MKLSLLECFEGLYCQYREYGECGGLEGVELALERSCAATPPPSASFSSLRLLLLLLVLLKMSLHPEAEFLFTSESVNEGHPNNLPDQVRGRGWRGSCDRPQCGLADFTAVWGFAQAA